MRRAAQNHGKSPAARTQNVEGRLSEKSRGRGGRRAVMEALESRTLLAVLPPASVQSLTAMTNAGGNESTPSIAMDPANPQNLAAVWTRIASNLPNQLQTIVEGAYSTNGGTSWQSLTLPGLQAQIDLSQSQANGPKYYTEITDPTIAFDGQHQLYLSYSEHSNTYSAGAIELEKFSFSARSPRT